MTSIKAPALPPLLPFAGRTPMRPDPAAFRGLAIASSGLSAQRLRMEIATANLANAETTRTAEGGAYQRRVVTMEPATPFGPVTQSMGDDVSVDGGVTVTGITRDASLGDLIYDPTHPDADREGYVRMPNVNATQELVTLMEARRLYEANATAFNSMKAMLRRAIDI
jgi:flagellar basal-body rod protein FlgC